MKERGRKRKKKTGERVIRNEWGGQVVGDGGGTHGDGGSGKKKHCYRCDSFHDFAVTEDDAGILLGDHVEALSPAHNFQL